ncbi:MAG TPA: hypothetical protein VGM28_07685 [Candidatus Limnocylindrales bacterium]|jgi:hypothetical protein
MRIYEGSPRQDFEEVFRSIGAFLDSRGMRDILLLEVPDGFVVQGLVAAGTATSAWSETVGSITKETLSFFDDDIAKFMEEAAARRGNPAPDARGIGPHERALRVVGRWMDEQKPKDVFLFEQDGQYVLRLLVAGQAGSHHEISEFTREDVDALVANGPDLRGKPKESQTAPIQAVAPLSAGVPAPAAAAEAVAAAPADADAAAASPGGWGDQPG